MKNFKKFGLVFLILGIIFASTFFIKSNKKDVTKFETTQLSKVTIETKIVATGKVIPEDEVEIKPQIPGIIDKILVKEGDKVKAGDLLVKIKVVPDEQASRFEDQVAAKDSGDKEAMDYDHDYITALEHGMPPAVGVGMGVDRLVMLLTNQSSIRDVLLFPQLKSSE